MLHHSLHAVHIEHDLTERPEDEVLQLHLILLAEDHQLGKATNLDKVCHKVLVLLEECLEREENLLELCTLGPLQLVQNLVGLGPGLLLLLGEFLHRLLEEGVSSDIGDMISRSSSSIMS